MFVVPTPHRSYYAPQIEGKNNFTLSSKGFSRFLSTEELHHGIYTRVAECERKASRLIEENKILHYSLTEMDSTIITLNQTVIKLQHLHQMQKQLLESLQTKNRPPTSNKRAFEPSETAPENDLPEKKKKKTEGTSVGLHEIRQRIPWRLNSGYVIHALLCCAMNGIGSRLVKDEDGKVCGIAVTSYWLVKASCSFLIQFVLCKKAKSSDASAWDKSLRQHWFEGWVSKDEFVALAKPNKRETLNELLEGHSTLTEQEKLALLERVDFTT